MGFEKSKADPCLYWKRTENGLLVWLSWIDGYLCVVHEVDVQKARAELLRRFKCDDIGDIEEYLGYEVERCREKRQVKPIQTVILQSYTDKFDLPPTGKSTNIPTLAGSVLFPEVKEEELVSKKKKIAVIELELDIYSMSLDGQDRRLGIRLGNQQRLPRGLA